jgi:hypothetical protein
MPWRRLRSLERGPAIGLRGGGDGSVSVSRLGAPGCKEAVAFSTHHATSLMQGWPSVSGTRAWVNESDIAVEGSVRGVAPDPR